MGFCRYRYLSCSLLFATSYEKPASFPTPHVIAMIPWPQSLMIVIRKLDKLVGHDG
jgi:hypothetical protein